jgi:hypothetical protein
MWLGGKIPNLKLEVVCKHYDVPDMNIYHCENLKSNTEST